MNSHYIHFSNKLTPILLILLHLFQSPHAIKWEWTNGTTCSVSYVPLILMVLLLFISKNKSVLTTFCIPVRATAPTYSFSHYGLLLPPPAILPQSYRVVVLELQARWKINKMAVEKKIWISTTIKQLLLTTVWPFNS